MDKLDLILIGAGGHARACIDVIEQQAQYHIAGMIGVPEEKDKLHLGYKVIATDDELPQLAKHYKYAFITVGQIQTVDIRKRLYQKAVKHGFQLPTIIAPTAYVSSHASIGAGTIVMHGVIINAGTKIGDNCIINTRSVIEHGAVVNEHCHIATCAVINGDAVIGSGSFVGSGSIIKEGVSIGKDSIVGMGLSVRHDLFDDANFFGKGN